MIDYKRRSTRHGANLARSVPRLISGMLGVMLAAAAAAEERGPAPVEEALASYVRARQAELLAATSQLNAGRAMAPFSYYAAPRVLAADSLWAGEELVFCCSMPELGYQDEPATQPAAVPEPEADEGPEDLAKKLQNPVADLISIPLQSNFEFGGGVDVPNLRGRRPLRRFLPRPANRALGRLLTFRLRQPDREQAFRYTLNLQPVIPFSLSEDWNLISRTILPVVYQDQVIGTTNQGGLGDTVQSLFFSPKKAEPFIWGAGPVFLLPTATDDVLGAERWGMGPTGVILKQDGPWTYGILVNHIWSFARDDGRKEVNATFLQPFLSHTFKTATTLSFSTEATYDWVGNQWTVPLQAGVSQLVKMDKLPVSLALNGRYWVEGPDTAPDWSVRFVMTFLLPK